MALPVPEQVSLKDPKTFRLIGQPTTRLDARAKSSGRQDYGIDVKLPGLLTAVIARPPVFGAKLASVDDAAARAVRGVKAVLRVPLDGGAEGVAVVAEGYWPAKQGRDALKLQWDTAAVQKVDSVRQLAEYRSLATQARPAPLRRRHGAAGHRAAAPRGRVRVPLPGARADGAAELHGACGQRRRRALAGFADAGPGRPGRRAVCWA